MKNDIIQEFRNRNSLLFGLERAEGGEGREVRHIAIWITLILICILKEMKLLVSVPVSP